MKLLTYLCSLLLIFCLAGCVTTGPVGYQSFSSKQGAALIYIYRESKFAASGVSADVVLDGKKIGTIPNGSFVAAYVSPGAHVLEVKFGTLNKLWYKDQKAMFSLSEGNRKYVRLDLTLTGLTVGGAFSNSTWSTGLDEVTEDTAEKEMQKLGLNNKPEETMP